MTYLPPDEAKEMLLNILMDYAEDDTERLFEYFAHVGFDVPAPDNSKQIPAAWLGHYRVGQGPAPKLIGSPPCGPVLICGFMAKAS